MPKRHYFLIVDTETTIKDTVADFGAVVVDRKGTIYHEVGALVHGHYGTHELFHCENAGELWSRPGLERRANAYAEMLANGSRSLVSVAGINRWLEKVKATYDPELTAYNLAFDSGKCRNTGIDLDQFDRRFCLMGAAQSTFGQMKRYRRFVLEGHHFNAPTAYGNMTYKTNAEVMAGFLTGNFEVEPHTALEDAKHFEVPILTEVLKRPKWREKMKPYNWREYQVRDHFSA